MYPGSYSLVSWPPSRCTTFVAFVTIKMVCLSCVTGTDNVFEKGASYFGKYLAVLTKLGAFIDLDERYTMVCI